MGVSHQYSDASRAMNGLLIKIAKEAGNLRPDFNGGLS